MRLHRLRHPFPAALWVCALWVALAPGVARSARIDLYPGHSFESAVEALLPGDTLTVHQGTYADYGRISVQVLGSPAAPVLIRAATGETTPVITRPSDSTPQNTINVEAATYLTISGLEITGNGDGIDLNNDPHHVTIEDCHIHHVDVGIGFHSSMHHITIRRNHIHDTGMGGATGEGLYVGCNYAACAVSESIFENNWIHDTPEASQGDGIEIKAGSWGNIVRDNVIYNTKYPCILLYGTSGQARNTVERNVVWNCGDSGIQCAADAVIRNNIILESPSNGFNSQDHQGVTPNNLEFTHNTIVGGAPVLRLSNWASKKGMVLANNAIYASSSTSFAVGSLTGVVVAGNVVYPSTSALPSSGYATGRSTALDFLNTAARNVYPSVDSKLLDAGSVNHAPADDFNGIARSGAPDAGAYTWTQPLNPGWPIGPGFKQLTQSTADNTPPSPIRDVHGQ